MPHEIERVGVRGIGGMSMEYLGEVRVLETLGKREGVEVPEKGWLNYLGVGLEYLGEGWSTWERDWSTRESWSTWKRGVGVPGRGGLSTWERGVGVPVWSQ